MNKSQDLFSSLEIRAKQKDEFLVPENSHSMPAWIA